MAKSGASPQGDKYQPVDCPMSQEEMCNAINAWAAALEKWAKDVTDAIWPSGPPGGSNPPPPPPFK